MCEFKFNDEVVTLTGVKGKVVNVGVDPLYPVIIDFEVKEQPYVMAHITNVTIDGKLYASDPKPFIKKVEYEYRVIYKSNSGELIVSNGYYTSLEEYNARSSYKAIELIQATKRLRRG